ncbi:MAG: hypothetical protein H6721_22365 [Sandaracinus sp.]|nr:hypothetical protein [Sandaracinus sp.]
MVRELRPGHVMKRLWLGVVLLWGACGDDDGAARDAGSADAARQDGGSEDGGDGLDSGADGGVDATLDATVDGAVDAGSDAGWPALPAPLGPLPAPTSALLDRFQTSQTCATCHQWSGAGSLEDASGRDVSQYTLWRSSVMALSARDPYFLAALSHEIEEHPEATDTIEATCTRCHAPAANEGLRASGAHPGLASLTTGVDSAANTARDGVTCTVCHQIEPTNLGTEASFSGGWMIGAGDVAYGPHTAPFETNMVNATGYRPAFGAHVSESESCATCHTLFTRALDATGTPSGPSFPEQVPYLEWLASDYAVGGSREASCQSCHVPTTDVDGRVISTPISSRPNRLAARSPYGRHVFTGANGYLLELFAANESWANTEVPAVELLASATASDAMLGRAASLAATTRRDGDRVVVEVDVTNESGHKLPTGYPSRRVFLRVEALDAAGAVVWASGRTNARGYLVDEGGRAIDGAYVVLPHRDVIDRQDQAQVYEAMMEDAGGAPTRVLLNAVAYAKDTRLLPHGWRADHPDADAMRPVGVEGDATFRPGSDRVTYRIPSAGVASVRVSLLYQSMPPTTIDGLRDHPTPATSRFVAITDATPPVPRSLVTLTRAVD